MGRALGEVLRKHRGKETQTTLGQRAGIPQGTLSDLEAGEATLDIYQLEDLCEALGVTPQVVWTEAEVLMGKWVTARAHGHPSPLDDLLGNLSRPGGSPGKEWSILRDRAAFHPGRA